MATNSDSRNNGIDLLRIVSSFYVIILHTLGLGGILSNTEPGTPQYSLFWFIEIWAYCAVNIFVILSGYAGYSNEEKKTDWSKYLILWLQVVFYSVLIAIIYKIIHPAMVDGKTILSMFFPVTNDFYWFFSAYTGLFIIKPFLDTAIRSINEKTLRNLIVIIFLVFCCFSMCTDPFRFSKGYSFSWFVILYIIGASLKKCQIEEKISTIKSVLALLSIPMCTLLWKLFGTDIRIMNFSLTRDSLISYVSPMTVTAAVFHVILFSKMRFTSTINKLISFFAPGAFAVYLINAHPCLWLNEFENRFSGWARLKPEAALIRVVGYAILFTGASLLIDKIRQFLFRKLNLRKTIHQFLYGPERRKALQKTAAPLYGISFLSIWAFLFWKCQIGYGNIDEALYLTVPYRLLKWGDGLLVHEWHEFQMSTFPMLPITMLYNKIFPGTEKIIFNFRLIYTFFWGCSSFFLYHRMKRFSRIGAATASLSYLIYAPYGIMALSYNSMGILFLLNACIIGITAIRYKRIQYIIAGIFLAGAVLCCPFLLILYLFLSIYTLIAFIKKTDQNVQIFWLFVTIGAFLLFMAFCAFLLSRASLSELIRSIPIVLDDIEHQDRSPINKTIQYISSIWHASSASPLILLFFIAACIFSKIKKSAVNWFLPILSAGTIIQILSFTIHKAHINCVMLPICMFGLLCALYSEDTKIRLLFYCLWIPGIIYTYCLNYSSNQGLYAITNASVVPSFASMIILVIFLRNINTASYLQKRILITCVSLLFIAQICSELYLRYNNVFWEDGVSEQTVYATTGPEQDILMTKAHLKEYNRIISELEPIRNNTDIDRVLFFTLDPVLYLCTEKAVGAFSSWLPGINQHTFARLELYYELNPEKTPGIIYIPNENADYLSRFEAMGYETNQTEYGNYILTQGND